MAELENGSASSDSSNRRAFYEDVVLTLLNLVDKYLLSHNDIRTANIALGQNGRFVFLILI